MERSRLEPFPSMVWRFGSTAPGKLLKSLTMKSVHFDSRFSFRICHSRYSVFILVNLLQLYTGYVINRSAAAISPWGIIAAGCYRGFFVGFAGIPQVATETSEYSNTAALSRPGFTTNCHVWCVTSTYSVSGKLHLESISLQLRLHFKSNALLFVTFDISVGL